MTTATDSRNVTEAPSPDRARAPLSDMDSDFKPKGERTIVALFVAIPLLAVIEIGRAHV